jgi:alkaline phosphatase
MIRIMKYWLICSIILLFPTHSVTKTHTKNMILMISDGCGYNHVLAADYYQYGKAGAQVYEKFPVQYAVSTFSATGNVYDPDKSWQEFDYIKEKPTDSAAATTAMAAGVKTTNKYLGVDPEKNRVTSILEYSEALGKSTGVVTSVAFCHATPAGFVVHHDNRNDYSEIVRQMLYESPVDVIMGCGHLYYDNDGKPKVPDPEDLVWVELMKTIRQGEFGNDADNDGQNDPWTFIEDKQAFKDLGTSETPRRILGMPQCAETLQQRRSGDDKADAFVVHFVDNVPTLSDMSLGALNVLDEDKDGFFLMIEGGAVDWCGHDNQKGRLIEEQIDFNKAVEVVVSWIETSSSWEETLLIITSDHETGYLWGEGSGRYKATDFKEIDQIWKPLINNGAKAMPGMEWHSGKHTNSLVPLYAKGEGSERFEQYAIGQDKVRGKYMDNTDIAKVMKAAFGIKQ